MRRLIVVGALLLAGCSTTYRQAGKTQMDFYNDLTECEARASMATGSQQIAYAGTNNPFASGWNQGAAIGAAARQRRIIDYCLKGKGWQPE